MWYRMKKIVREFLDHVWLWGPAIILCFVFFLVLYYKAHYCKEIPCTRIGTRCVKSHIENNGHWGKYHREWEVCDEEETYEYESTYDSCGCTKLK